MKPGGKLLCVLIAIAIFSAVVAAKYHYNVSSRRPAMMYGTGYHLEGAEEDVIAHCPVARPHEGTVGIFAKNLATGRMLVLNPDRVFAAASTIKVPVSIVVYEHFYYPADTETRKQYDTGIELMMMISENDYFAEFLDEIEEKIGPEEIRKHFSHIGMQKTMIRDPKAKEMFGYSNVTTARDMGVVFEQLYRGQLLNAEKTAFILEALANTIFGEEMARYMQGRKVIHKIGELDNVLADVGIVEGETAPVLMSNFIETDLSTEYASDYIATVSACLYENLSGEKAGEYRNFRRD